MSLDHLVMCNVQCLMFVVGKPFKCYDMLCCICNLQMDQKSGKGLN